MIALDTNSLISYLRGDRRILERMNTAERVALPSFVVGEYFVGVLRGDRGERQRTVYEQFVAKPQVEVLLPNLETSFLYARLRSQLLAAGTPVGTNDVWIAALCIQRDIPLLTRDHDFRHLQGLRIIEP